MMRPIKKSRLVLKNGALIGKLLIIAAHGSDHELKISTTPATTNRSPLFNDTSSTTLGAASYQVAGTAGAISDTYTGTASQNWSMAMAAFRPATTSATVGTTTAIKYIHDDHLGGANVVTDSSGLIAETLQYYPYGSLRTDTLSNSYQGQRRKYIGQPYDASTAYNYLGARYENPSIGRFTSEDPIFVQSPENQNIGNPQDLNSYSYSDDNPIRYEDPNGKFVQEAFTVLGGAGASVGAYLLVNHFNGTPDTWQGIEGAAVGGAVGGALLGVGDPQGFLEIANAGGVSSAVTALDTDYLDSASGQKVSLKKAAADTIGGYGFGAIFGGLGGVVSRFAAPAASGLSESLSESSISGLNNISNNSYNVNQVNTVVRPVVTNTLNTGINFAAQVAQGVTQSSIPTSIQNSGQSLNYIQAEINYIQQEINNLTGHH